MRVGARDSEEKQRKNRLSRLLNFVEKIIWYAVDKKSKDRLNSIMIDLLDSDGWVNADSRPDLWLLGDSIINAMNEEAKVSLTKKIVSEYKKYK